MLLRGRTGIILESIATIIAYLIGVMVAFYSFLSLQVSLIGVFGITLSGVMMIGLWTKKRLWYIIAVIGLGISLILLKAWGYLWIIGVLLVLRAFIKWE